MEERMEAMFMTIILIACLALCGAWLVYGHGKQTKRNIEVMSEKETQSPRILGDEDSKISIPLGCDIVYSHSVHGSVGYDYSMEYDRTAFKLSENLRYNNPDAVANGMCGGDKAILTSTLTTMKKGRFIIKIIHTFRGSQERVITHDITVK